ncbi:choline/carnitine O-acyltransferase, partial [Neisseria sp. P0003.S003]
TYCYNTSTKRLYLHCEHTWADGGALKGIVTLAAAKLAARGGKKTRPAVHRYEWQLDADLLKNWDNWQQNYAKQADQMHVTSVTI